MNAGGRTRTDMRLLSLDFESSAYANFATPARELRIIKLFDIYRQLSRKPLRGRKANLPNCLPFLRRKAGVSRINAIRMQ